MEKQKFLIFVVIFLMALAACSRVEETPPDPVPESSTKGIAEVESIEILKLLGQPDQVRVAAHLRLPDQCTFLDNVDVQQSGNAFRITITTVRGGVATCTEKAVEVERLISIGEAGLPPGTYNVAVNDVSSRFELAAEPAPLSVAQEVVGTDEQAAQDDEGQSESGATVDTAPQPGTDSDEQDQNAESSAGPAAAAGEESSGDSQTENGQNACEEKVGFYEDVTVPDDTFFRQGETFTKVWKLRNEGTCSWEAGYALVFAGGHILNAPLNYPLPFQVAPGEIFELSLDMAAPSQGGTYVSKWLLQNPQGEQFGLGSSRQDVIYTRIVVGWIPPGGTSGDSSGGEAGAAGSGPGVCAVAQDPTVEGEILNLINSERLGRGLRRLALEVRLASAARGHSADMACNNFTDHTGSDGSTWRTRVEREGYTPGYVSENIFYGGTAQEAFDWWMESQVHKDNILSAKVSEIGIGFASYAQSRWVRYYTLVFASP